MARKTKQALPKGHNYLWIGQTRATQGKITISFVRITCGQRKALSREKFSVLKTTFCFLPILSLVVWEWSAMEGVP